MIEKTDYVSKILDALKRRAVVQVGSSRTTILTRAMREVQGADGPSAESIALTAFRKAAVRDQLSTNRPQLAPR